MAQPNPEQAVINLCQRHNAKGNRVGALLPHIVWCGPRVASQHPAYHLKVVANAVLQFLRKKLLHIQQRLHGRARDRVHREPPHMLPPLRLTCDLGQ